MSNDLLRWVIALAIFAHGVGHLLFMPLLSGALRLETSGHSWLLTGLLGDGPVKLVATAAAAAALTLFLVASGGVVLQATWWRGVATAAAVVSLLVVAAMWDGLPTSSAALGLAFDVVVLAALLFVRWPSTQAVGS